MSLFSLEHSPAAVRADFAVYGIAVAALAVALGWQLPPGGMGQALAWAGAGLGGWTALEYALHRFVLHGLQPFVRWHAEHHARPKALLALPTLASAGLFALLVALPAFALLPHWRATALLLGVLLGYLGYTVTHHAVHHWTPRGAWGRERRRWHALHHARPAAGGYGVSLSFWDHVLRTSPRRR